MERDIITSKEAFSRLGTNLKVIEIRKLRPHENVENMQLKNMVERIGKNGCLKRAIVADINTLIIIDGHCRTKALVELGHKKIPVILIDYSSPMLKVISWKDSSMFPKEMVIKAGLSGKLLPPKTTKHLVIVNGSWMHISVIEPEVNFTLQKLVANEERKLWKERE
ncbi:MAG: hypothetical protein ACUVUS_04860 [Thermoproteota archaeon]